MQGAEDTEVQASETSSFADKNKQEFKSFELKTASKKGKKKASRIIEIPSSSSESDSLSDSDSDLSDDMSTWSDDNEPHMN